VILVRGSTSFLPASAPASPPSLSTCRCPKRTTRPTDFCHLNDSAAPAPRAFPARCRDFHRVDAPRSLMLRAALPGTGRITTSWPLRRIIHRTRVSKLGASRASTVTGVGHERGRCLPTVHDAIEPLTPLSPLPLALGLTHLRACSLRKYRSRSFGVARGSLGRESRQDHFPRRLVKGDASHDPGCLPSVRTLRRIRWPLPCAHWPYAHLAAPVPRPRHRFWRCRDRWMTLSRHPGSSSSPHRYIDALPTRGPSFRTTRSPTFHRRRSPRLGPRSLDA